MQKVDFQLFLSLVLDDLGISQVGVDEVAVIKGEWRAGRGIACAADTLRDYMGFDCFDSELESEEEDCGEEYY